MYTDPVTLGSAQCWSREEVVDQCHALRHPSRRNGAKESSQSYSTVLPATVVTEASRARVTVGKRIVVSIRARKSIARNGGRKASQSYHPVSLNRNAALSRINCFRGGSWRPYIIGGVKPIFCRPLSIFRAVAIRRGVVGPGVIGPHPAPSRDGCQVSGIRRLDKACLFGACMAISKRRVYPGDLDCR